MWWIKNFHRLIRPNETWKHTVTVWQDGNSFEVQLQSMVLFYKGATKQNFKYGLKETDNLYFLSALPQKEIQNKSINKLIFDLMGTRQLFLCLTKKVKITIQCLLMYTNQFKFLTCIIWHISSGSDLPINSSMTIILWVLVREVNCINHLVISGDDPLRKLFELLLDGPAACLCAIGTIISNIVVKEILRRLSDEGSGGRNS